MAKRNPTQCNIRVISKKFHIHQLPFKARTQSSLVSFLTFLPDINKISSPALRPPGHVHLVFAAGEDSAVHCTYKCRTHSFALDPPSKRKPRPSFSPGNL